ncbi:ponticulin-related protein [Dictyostelium discoideum AX4]|uniref:Ponticulin-like protein J n=1 Tax=Dictyostelium discoideum TaxID=44689 RepID=PONJ_DICDI|nr:ponticulin-related protein [Dictyostelium discoideum AX4]Q54GU3.1 RecName: Full=Ponticulin-like protein J; Flags: Precursor [Dictyostelium discoideum]EAL62472.1 ponticulin-related protein [Dictyostelium discoideum AX4]|eukprot:XP_635976.1 ponticulin-related protein [Dictyostelium discoideum AX4]
MRLLNNLILMVVLFVAVSNATTKFTFNTFSVRNTEDQTCFTKTAKTTDDSTKVDINKCTVGCGGSMKIRKGTKSQQYQFELFSSTDCTGETTSKVLFVCPNPSIDAISIKSTSNTIKCGTLPPDSEIKEDDTATAVVNDENNNETKNEPKTKTKSTPKSPSTPKTNNSNEDSDLTTSSSDSSSSTKSSPKSKSSTEVNENKPKSDNETAEGNNASSNIATFSLVIISLLVASLF